MPARPRPSPAPVAVTAGGSGAVPGRGHRPAGSWARTAWAFVRTAVSAPWAPYAVAGSLLLADYLVLMAGLDHLGPNYAIWGLNHQSYTDILKLSYNHYLQSGHLVHPLPYIHDRIEYPILLGFLLWLPTWLPGGPAMWLAAAGIMTAAATFGAIALVRRRRPNAAWWLAASPALFLDGGINWDLVGIFFLVGAVCLFAERRYAWSGVLTAAGALVKLFPIVVVPMAVTALAARWWRSLWAARRRSAAEAPDGPTGGWQAVRDLAGYVVPLVVTLAVVLVPFLLVSRRKTLWFYRYNNLRKQKDDIWSVVHFVTGPHVVNTKFINHASLALVVATAAVAVVLVWCSRPSRSADAVALATGVVVIVWMACNKIWNPQYILWVFAVGAFTGMPAVLGVALGAVSILDYWYEFVARVPDHVHHVDLAKAYTNLGYATLSARALVFGLMALWCLWQLVRCCRGPDLPG